MKYLLAMCTLLMSCNAYGWYYVPKNRFHLFVGVGPTGLNTNVTNSSVLVKQKTGVFYGAGYERRVDKRTILSTQVFSNGSGVVGLGFEF